MTRDEAVRRMQRILGFRGDLADDCVFALQEAQEDLESRMLGMLPWFLRVTAEYIIPASETELRVPRDFLAEYDHEVSPLWLDGVGPVMRVDYFAPDGYGTSKTGDVVYWLDTGDTDSDGNPVKTIRISSEFSDSKTAEYLYYKKDEQLTQDIENLWLEHASRLMIGLAGGSLAGTRDRVAADRFSTMETSGRSSILRQDTAFRTASRKPQMGTDRRIEQRGVIRRYNDFDDGR